MQAWQKDLPWDATRRASLAEQRGKKSAEFSEEPARRWVFCRCRSTASRLRRFACLGRQGSCQNRSCLRTRIERQRAHLLNRRRRRSGRVEHKRRFHLHVRSVGATEASSGAATAGAGFAFKGGSASL